MGRLTGVLRFDGGLDEAAWVGGDPIASLTQTEPVAGAAPAGRTAVCVVAHGEGLVLEIRADDAAPSHSTSFACSRDAVLSSDDHLEPVLDTYLDDRSGFIFGINPNGARHDARVVNQGEGQSGSWNRIDGRLRCVM